MRRETRSPRRAMAPTVTSGLIVCIAVALALLGHIRLKAELDRLYTGIGRLDRELAEARRANEKLQVDLTTLTSPDGLGSRLRKLRLDLVMPGDDARVVLPEPGDEATAAVRNGAALTSRGTRLAGGMRADFNRETGTVRVP